MQNECETYSNLGNTNDQNKQIIESIIEIVTEEFILDQNYIINGNLNVNTRIIANDITNMKGIKEAKNLSDLIGKNKNFIGDITIDTLIVSEKLNFKLKVTGDSKCNWINCIWNRED